MGMRNNTHFLNQFSTFKNLKVIYSFRKVFNKYSFIWQCSQSSISESEA